MKRLRIRLLIVLSLSIFDSCAVTREGETTIPANLLLTEKTTYSINKDIDLHGKTLVVPRGCSLIFNGGSIKNGTLKGNDTRLINLKEDCLLCYFEGTFSDLSINVSSLGLHPSGDGSVKKTRNQHSVFERVSTLFPCVRNLVLDFENGFYGCGYGDYTPQGAGQSNRLWYGYYAFYYYDYNKESILESLTIHGNGAKFVNVFPYYIGAWTKEDGTMKPYYKWSNSDKDQDKCRRATESGGFLYFRSKRPASLNIVDLSFDMNKDILYYGGYQYWTQEQCGLNIITKGSVYVNNIEMKNNVTDGMIVLSKLLKGEEIYPQKVEVLNSRFTKNMRMGLSLCAGEENIVNNCKFEDNGRLYDVNGHYCFEGPWSDIDIEPIIQRSFRSVSINSCTFKNSNIFCVVSAHQNLESFEIQNCSAENYVPRLYYSRETDSKGVVSAKINEMHQPTVFMKVNAIKKLSVKDILLRDILFSTGESYICERPIQKAGYKSGDIWLKKKPSVRATASGIRIISGDTYHRNTPVNLLDINPKLINYKYDASTNKWSEIESTIKGIGYGGWDISDITYTVGKDYGVLFSKSNNEGNISISSLVVVVTEPRVRFPLISGFGISEQSGISIDRMEVIDQTNENVTLKKEPPIHSKRVKTLIYRTSSKSSGVNFPAGTKVQKGK